VALEHQQDGDESIGSHDVQFLRGTGQKVASSSPHDGHMNSTETTTAAQDPSAQLDPNDPRHVYARATKLTAQTMRAITAEQYSLPTCTAMSVAQLCEHLVMVQRRVACAGRGQAVAQWPIAATDVASGEWADAFIDASHDVQSAWSADVLDRATQLPWGEFSGREVLAVYANELSVHTWDLARATGQQPEWDGDVLEVSLAAIHAQLPDADRRPMWDALAAQMPEGVPWESPFGNAVAVSDDAPTIDRLVAWNGRQP
jgi:uncharacterized protein (TIGR03086 family)